MRKASYFILFLLAVGVSVVVAALVVPTDIQQPGSQPGEVGNLETPDKCDNCHGGYNTAVEPAHNWRGSMMANAGRDPIFWATLAVAEQDFDGSGDLCIRCHSTSGWLGGRSTPTDGSALKAGDADGVECDYCHKLTNPDRSEHLGIQNAPFIANDEKTPATGYYGSGMGVLWGGNEKLGPYTDAAARHQSMPSVFHRDTDYCGTCHDVSNPAVGDLAHNNGAQIPLVPGTFSGVPGSPVNGKAAFNNFPFQYGVVERTFSEFNAGLLSRTRVGAYASLPAELKAGAIQAAYESSIVAGTGGDYADGSPRYFSCQTCHMRPVTGQGCNKNPPVRKDLPLHDMTGGNYWMPDAILYQNGQGTLRLGGGLTATQIAALNDGKTRALQQLSKAASLSVTGKTLRVVNLTGHKLISGYPEGRRMWLNVKWYGAGNVLLREDGQYGPLAVTLDGQSRQVDTILDPYNPDTKVYEAHYGMTQEWAAQLIALGVPGTLVLDYDRLTGVPVMTLGELAGMPAGSVHETFHFVLNNTVAKDNRIPPYGMSYDEAAMRNALPVPAAQFGSPGPGGTFNHFDAITLDPPVGASYATIDLLYQPTSWEYIQFLYLANNRQNAFLADEGVNLLNAWLATGMAAPYKMASTTSQFRYTLTLASSPSDGGTITADPLPDGDGKYAYGTAVTLTASPATGYALSSWSGDATGSDNPVLVTMDGDKSVTATFAVGRTLSLEVMHSNYGSVSVEPNLPLYPDGSTVTLTALPIEGKAFAGWSLYDPNHPGDPNYISAVDPNTLGDPLVLPLVMNADWKVDADFKCGSGVNQALPLLVVGLGACMLFTRVVRRRR